MQGETLKLLLYYFVTGSAHNLISQIKKQVHSFTTSCYKKNVPFTSVNRAM